MLAAELGDALEEFYATAAQPRTNISFKELFSYALAGSGHAQNYVNTPPAVGDGHLYSLVEGGLLAAVSVIRPPRRRPTGKLVFVVLSLLGGGPQAHGRFLIMGFMRSLFRGRLWASSCLSCCPPSEEAFGHFSP